MSALFPHSWVLIICKISVSISSYLITSENNNRSLVSAQTKQCMQYHKSNHICTYWYRKDTCRLDMTLANFIGTFRGHFSSLHQASTTERTLEYLDNEVLARILVNFTKCSNMTFKDHTSRKYAPFEQTPSPLFNPQGMVGIIKRCH